MAKRRHFLKYWVIKRAQCQFKSNNMANLCNGPSSMIHPHLTSDYNGTNKLLYG